MIFFKSEAIAKVCEKVDFILWQKKRIFYENSSLL
jgi:hypothetical protein